MYNILIDFIDDGEKLLLSDGTIWLVNPGDISISCCWTPTVNINRSKKYPNSFFDYVLTNMSNKQFIRARKMDA